MYQLSRVRAVQHYRMVMGLMTFKHLSVILSLDNITMRGFHLNVSYALHIQPFPIFAVIYSPIIFHRLRSKYMRKQMVGISLLVLQTTFKRQ